MLTPTAEKFIVPGCIRTAGVFAGADSMTRVKARRPQSDPAPTTAAGGAASPGSENTSEDDAMDAPTRKVRLGIKMGAESA